MLVIMLSKLIFVLITRRFRISYLLFGLWNLMEIVLLATAYRRYQQGMLSLVDAMTASNRNLALFMVVIFATPVLLILI